MYKKVKSKIRKEIGRRPLLLAGLLLLICAGIRLPFLVQHSERMTLPDGQAECCGCVTDVEMRDRNLRFTVKMEGGGGVLVYVPLSLRIKNLAAAEIGAVSSGENNSLSAEMPEMASLVGSTMRFRGEYQAFRPAGNPGQFDMKTYYFVRGLQGQVFAEQAEITETGAFSLQRLLWILRNKASIIIDGIYDAEYAGIIKTMLLGDRAGLLPETRDLYRRNGIAHILAISGLHVTFLGQMVKKSLEKVCGKGLAAPLISCALLLFYVLLAGAGAPAVRAFLFFLLSNAAEVTGRGYDMISAWMFSLAFLVTWNPGYLLDGGFYLSFGAAGAFTIHGLLKPDLIPDYISSAILLQLILFPIAAFCYFEYPVYSILLNLIVVPAMTWVMKSAVLGLALGALAGWPAGSGTPGPGIFSLIQKAAVAASFPSSLILKIYHRLCVLFQKLPGAVMVTGKPSVVRIAVYYAVFFFILTKESGQKTRAAVTRKESGQKRKTARTWVITAGRAITEIIVLVLLLCVRVPSPSLTVIMQDVGQGDSIFLRSSTGYTCLIDAGSSDVNEAGKYRVIPFLKSQAVTELDCVFLTHSDEDHINAMREILESPEEGISADTLVMTYIMAKSEKGRELSVLAEKAGTDVRVMKAGDQVTDGDLTLLCLCPGTEASDDLGPNEASLVLSLTYKNFRMLLTGDLEGEGEKALLESEAHIKNGGRYTVLKVAHHGSAGATSESFLKEYSADFALISCGYRNRYGHPEEELLGRLSGHGIRWFRTDTGGAVTVRTTGENIRISTQLHAPVQYFDISEE